MFHKDVSTGNIVKCDSPDFCHVSNVHADSRNELSKIYSKMDRQLRNIDKLSKKDASNLLKIKNMEVNVLEKSVKSLSKNIERMVIAQGESSPATTMFRTKYDNLKELLDTTEEQVILLSYKVE